jgi:hypothetical protein
MFQYRARQAMRDGNGSAPAAGAAPPAGVRYALPGERPPSTRPPGSNDDVIERFDLYAQRFRKGGAN